MQTSAKVKKRIHAAIVHTCCYSLLFAQTVPFAYAGPTGAEVVGGAGTIQQSGNTTTINQSTQNMSINWQSYNVGVDERVQYVQPNSSSISLNRILSNNGSTIAGRIDANGRVILVNPNGIFFTPTSVLNVGSLIASGLDINPNDFMNGQYIFNGIEGTNGTVTNSGIINASLGGNVALLGKQVQNDGMIVANLGTVSLAAGKQTILTFDNDGLLGVRVSKEILQSELGVDPAIINSGTIQAQGGKVLLTASQSQDIFSKAVNANGIEQATSVVVHDDGSFTLGNGADVVNSGTIDTSTTSADQNAGRIVLLGENVTNSGTIKADAQTGNAGEIELHANNITLLTQNSMTSARSESNGNGGIVKVLGDKVGLFDQAKVDVSGANGGGQALIGGDYRGENRLIRNASATYLDTATQINADAIQQGNGGKVIVWGTDSAKAYGAITARGGRVSGNGGFVETSSNVVDLDLSVDVSATNGTAGEWLIDPFNITISSAGNSSGGWNSNRWVATGDSNINVGNLIGTLGNGATVTVETGAGGSPEPTGGNITLSSALDLDNKNDGRASTLILRADHDINIDAQIYDSGISSADPLNLVLTANNNGTGGGDVNISALVNTANGTFTATGDNINLNSGGRIVTGGPNVTLNANTGGTINLGSTSADPDIASSGGRVRLNGNVVLTNNVAINAGGGDILFSPPGTSTASYTVNSQNATPRELTLTGDDVTFSGAVGGSQRLGALSISATGDVNAGTNTITANSLTVSQSTSFRSGALVTTSNATDGGGVAITSSGAVNVGAINTSATGVSGNGGTIAINTSDAVSVGAINSSAAAAAGNGGTININATAIALNGDIDARGGATGVSQTAQLSLTAAGAITINHPGNFSSSIRLTGSTGIDTLIGANRANTWQITGADDGVLNTNITFSDIENLTGNASTDDFIVDAAGTVTGTIDGDTGVNTLTGRDDANTWTITSANRGHVGLSAGPGSYVNNFTNIQTLIGSNQTDIFQLHNTANFTGSINGGAGTDELRGGNRTTTWTVTGANNTGTVTGLAAGNTFTNVETLTGGSGQDIFQLHDTVDFTGTVNGGGGTDEVRGGNRVNAWSITGVNTATVTGLSAAFTDVENLTGNGDTDTFVYSAGSSLSGVVNGAGGTDTVNQSALAVVSIRLGPGRFSNIENFIGNNPGNPLGNSSTLIGDNVANTWNIVAPNAGTVTTGGTTINFSGFNNLTGGTAADDFTLTNASDITGTLAGGTGGDSLAVNAGTNTWTLTGANTGNVTNGIGTTSFNSIENLRGGINDDTFTFNAGSSVAGRLDGGAGLNDSVNLAALTTVNVTLGATGFSNIERYIGNNTASTLTGDATTNTWTVTGLNDGTVNDITFVDFNNLVGGADVDTFAVNANASIDNINTGNGATNSVTVAADSAVVYAITGGTGADTIDVSGTVNVINAGAGNDMFTLRTPGAVNTDINGDDGDDTFTVLGGTIGGRIDGGSETTAIGDRVTLRDGETVNIGSGIRLGGITINDIEGVISRGGTLNAQTSFNTTWNINGENSGAVVERDSGGSTTATLSFGGFSTLNGSDGNDTFNITADGSISGLITAGDGNNSLNVTLTATRPLGHVNFIGGADTDTVLVTGTSNTAVYSSAVREGAQTYDRLAYTGANTFTVDYTAASVESVTDQVAVNTFAVNGTAGDDRITLDSAAFSVNGATAVDFTNKGNTNWIVDAGLAAGNQIGNDTITVNDDFTTTGDVTLRNAASLTQAAGSTLSADELIIDRIVAVSALNTDIAALSVREAGAVSINQTGNLALNEVNTGSLAVVASGNITDTNTAQRNITGTLSLTTAGNILLDEANYNFLSGPISVSGATININNGVATNLAAVNATNALTVTSAGAIAQSGAIIAPTATFTAVGQDINLNHADNDFRNITANAASLTLRDRDRIDGGNLTANTITLDTVTGVGAAGARLQTHTANLTINNAISGGIYVANDQAVQVSLTNRDDIDLANTGNVVVERLYATSGNYNTAGDVTLNVAGAVSAYTGPGSHTATHSPDIIARNLTVNTRGDFGTPGRSMSIRVDDTFAFFGARGYVFYFGARPASVIGAEDLVVFSGLAGLSNQQLIEIESLEDIDPAIFTAVRNYYHEDVAIMMPKDQRFDAADDDEEKNKEESQKSEKQ